MESTIIGIIVVAAIIAGIAFYTGHLRGVAKTLTEVHANIVAQASAHGSVLEELRSARNQLQALLRSSKAPAVESVTSAAAAVAAVAPQPPPDPNAARKAALAQSIADAQAELAKL